MKRALLVATAGVVVAAVTGCGVARVQTAARTQRIAIPADRPPSPTTWPKYPRFPRHSCWGRTDPHALLGRVAPSYAPAPRTHPIPPAVVARRLLARFGDRRYVRSIKLTRARHPEGRHVRVHPPTDALQAEIVVRGVNLVRHPSPKRALTNAIAEFERTIVGGALRDDLCDAGGAPLVTSEKWWALDQRFPNPSPPAFRKRVALVGRRFGFTVLSLRLLRPRQIAPLLIVRTHRPRKAFIADVVKIEESLNPASHSRSPNRSAVTFEAFFFAAEDARGPFVFTEGETRGGWSSGEWVAPGCPYPYTVHGDVGRVGPCS